MSSEELVLQLGLREDTLTTKEKKKLLEVSCAFLNHPSKGSVRA
jgi:hypothetical protein